MNIYELYPLTTANFYTTSAVDVNDNGDVVGSCWFYWHNQPGKPARTATLWEKTRFLRWKLYKYYSYHPTPLTNSQNLSEGLKINNRGEVVYVEYDSPTNYGNPTFFLWKKNNSTINLHTVITDLQQILDMNDQGEILATKKDGSVIIHNLDQGTHRILPSPPGSIIGLDNMGRVAVKSPLNELLYNIYWLPQNSSVWVKAEFNAFFGISLSKDGLILAAIADNNNLQFPWGRAGYYDLNQSKPSFILIPSRLSLPNHPPSYPLHMSTAYDCAQGKIVGTEGYSFPVLFDIKSNELVDMSDWFSEHVRAEQARGISHTGHIIGYGIINFGTPINQVRAWLLEMYHEPSRFGSPLTYPLPWPWPQPWPLIMILGGGLLTLDGSMLISKLIGIITIVVGIAWFVISLSQTGRRS